MTNFSTIQSENFLANSAPRVAPCASEAHACGKAIIVGEHAVVYGARAVAMPLKSHQLQVRLQPEQRDGASTIKFFLGDKLIPQHVADVWRDAMTLLNVPATGFTIRGKSTLPVGAGLGSSATLCVAALRSLTAAFGIDIDQHHIASLANKLEERFHGKPSGLDASVVAHEKVILFKKKQAATAFTTRDTWRFALVDSGIRASTLAMIRIAAPFFTGKLGERRIARFDELSVGVKDGLAANDLSFVAAAMNETGALLSEAGVVSKELAHIIEECRNLGAPAAKSTGAGGGGAVLVLLSPEGHEREYAAIINHFGSERVFNVSLEATHAD